MANAKANATAEKKCSTAVGSFDIEEFAKLLISTDNIEGISRHCIHRLHPVFITNTFPNKIYESFLWYITKNLPNYTTDQRLNLSIFLMRCETGNYTIPITGIMNITSRNRIYNEYNNLLSSIYDAKHPCPFKKGNSIDLCNSTIMMLMRKIENGCEYGANCIRKNPLHANLFHKQNMIIRKYNNSTRSRNKRNNRSRSPLRNRNHSQILKRHSN